jgi:hypothetical protein
MRRTVVKLAGSIAPSWIASRQRIELAAKQRRALPVSQKVSTKKGYALSGENPPGWRVFPPSA